MQKFWERNVYMVRDVWAGGLGFAYNAKNCTHEKRGGWGEVYSSGWHTISIHSQERRVTESECTRVNIRQWSAWQQQTAWCDDSELVYKHIYTYIHVWIVGGGGGWQWFWESEKSIEEEVGEGATLSWLLTQGLYFHNLPLCRFWIMRLRSSPSWPPAPVYIPYNLPRSIHSYIYSLFLPPIPLYHSLFFFFFLLSIIPFPFASFYTPHPSAAFEYPIICSKSISRVWPVYLYMHCIASCLLSTLYIYIHTYPSCNFIYLYILFFSSAIIIYSIWFI